MIDFKFSIQTRSSATDRFFFSLRKANESILIGKEVSLKKSVYSKNPKAFDIDVVTRLNGETSYACHLGSENDLRLHDFRKAAASLARYIKKKSIPSLDIVLPDFFETSNEIQTLVEGLLLGAYEFNDFKTSVDTVQICRVSIVTKQSTQSNQKALSKGLLYSDAVNFVRDLVNTPASDMDPSAMTAVAKRELSKSVTLKVFNKRDIQKMGMGALLGVNSGSGKPPVFLHMVYKPKGVKVKRRIGICGKGITFDSGGLSLKPAKSMETMKDDMTGAATVIALFRVLPKLNLPIEVHGFTPLTENMPGCFATKPGDVLKTMDGKTIEVLNTDAEGRLVLSDTLCFAQKQKLDEVIDIATLTGACVVALGTGIAGILGTDSSLISRLKESSIACGEKVWELPLDKDYESMLHSHVADIKNIGPTGVAGTILGALFLKAFVKADMPWAHLDIASTAWSDSETALSSPGATGVMVRTLLHYLESYL